MIRLKKSAVCPPSLARRKSWSEQDTQKQLDTDHNGKCYLCEHVCGTDYEVEHLKSRNNHEELTYDWQNLFFSCSYCNGKKKDNFDDILNPTGCDIEDIIRHDIDFIQSKVSFTNTNGNDTVEISTTISLLDRIFNGSGKLRTHREQKMYNQLRMSISTFLELATSWLDKHDDATKTAIISELDIKAEFLGFKYWIVKNEPELAATFAYYMVWNRTVPAAE